MRISRERLAGLMRRPRGGVNWTPRAYAEGWNAAILKIAEMGGLDPRAVEDVAKVRLDAIDRATQERIDEMNRERRAAASR